MNAPARRPHGWPSAKRLHETYDAIALVLQGGGALGSYQAGVYQGLAEAGIHPSWVAGISIGALNAAVIAGNPPGQRVEQLDRFWRTICRQPFFPPTPVAQFRDYLARLPPPFMVGLESLEATRAILEGQNGFFTPRLPLALLANDPEAASLYDTTPLKKTLEEFVDFDRLNSGEMRVSVGAVNVANGNFAYFDTDDRRLEPEHIIASGALPPGFAAVMIDGDYYWDGGVVSNTPLMQVLTSRPRRHSLVFQVDLWSASGPVPRNLGEVATRQKDIQYSSRTRLVTSYMREMQDYRGMLKKMLDLIPEEKRGDEAYRKATELACDRRYNVLHLIYRNKGADSSYKDYQFGLLAMEAHWQAGLEDIERTLDHAEWFDLPPAEEPFVTHDVHRLHQHDADRA